MTSTTKPRWIPSPEYHDPCPDRKIASPLIRVLARVVDWYLVLTLSIGVNRLWVGPVLDPETVPTDNLGLIGFGSPALVGVATVVMSVVWEFLWLLTEGATPGKQLFGLYVLDVDSRRGIVEAWAAMKRLSVRAILFVPFGWIAAAAISVFSLVLMVDDQVGRRSLMDRFADTTVRALPPGSPRSAPWFWVWISLLLAILVAGFVIGARSL